MALQTREKQACNVGSSSGPKQVSELRISDLPSRRLIGKGPCGIVYETTLNGKKYARKDFMDVPREIFRDEAAVLLGLQDHKNIVKVHGLAIENRSCSLVLQYMDDDLQSLLRKKIESKRIEAEKVAGKLSRTSSVIHSSLNEFIERRKNPDVPDTSPPPLELQEALHVMLEIATGMAHLHEHKVVHGDLKPRNVLVTYSTEGVQSVKVADFGLVQTKTQSTLFGSHRARKLDIAQWKAPEYLDKMFGRKLRTETLESDSDEDEDPACCLSYHADVYSFAVTSFQILTGEVPYPNLNWKDLVKKIVSQELRPNLPAALQSKRYLNDLLKSCWGSNLAQRPTFSDICKRLSEKRILETTVVPPSEYHTLKGRTEVDMISEMEQGLLPRQGQRVEKSIQIQKIGFRQHTDDPIEIGMASLSNYSAGAEAVSKVGNHSGDIQILGKHSQKPPVLRLTEIDSKEDEGNDIDSVVEALEPNFPEPRKRIPAISYKATLEELNKVVKLQTIRVERQEKRIANSKHEIYNTIAFFSFFVGVILTAATQTANSLKDKENICETAWIPVILTVCAWAFTIFVVWKKFTDIQVYVNSIQGSVDHIQRTVNRRKEIQRDTAIPSMLRNRGREFDFIPVPEDKKRDTPPPYYGFLTIRFGIIGILSLFTGVVIYTYISIYCNRDSYSRLFWNPTLRAQALPAVPTSL